MIGRMTEVAGRNNTSDLRQADGRRRGSTDDRRRSDQRVVTPYSQHSSRWHCNAGSVGERMPTSSWR